MKSFIALLVVDSFIISNAARFKISHGTLDAAVQPAIRSDLPPCPCTIWRHCDPNDILPEHGGERHYDGTSDGQGVSCVSAEDAVISLGHQVQCVPPRHGGLNYYCPPELSVKCDPAAPCRETELDTCQESDCPRPEWLPKEQHAAFCAMEECTHAECCDQGAVAVSAPSQPPTEPPRSCDERVNALAEVTLARLVAYQTECQFNAGDVNYGGQVAFENGQFDLTDHGQRKLWAEHCQHVPALQNPPDDVFADAQALQRECPDHARLNAQLNPMGIFGTTQVLDHFWRSCRDAGMDTCAPEPAAPTPAPLAPSHMDTMPAAPPIPAPAPVAPAPAPPSCRGPVTFTAQIEINGHQYEQSFTLDNAPEGATASEQCNAVSANAEPLLHGSFTLRCENGNWAIANHGIPCWNNEADARRAAESDSQAGGGYQPVQHLVDVTGIVDRMQDREGSDLKCCCDSRLDSSLWSNWRIHRRWNRREHTGVCTVHDTGETCSRTNSETPTHSHDRTEGALCIVDDADRANWERILHLNHPSGPRYVQTNNPTVTAGTAPSEYRDCVPAHSIGECERCTHSVQCAEGWYCCPFMKMCVQDSNTQCPSGEIAQCSGCFERFQPDPEQCSCQNPAFPRSWLPQCQ